VATILLCGRRWKKAIEQIVNFARELIKSARIDAVSKRETLAGSPQKKNSPYECK